ncbi:secreted protein [Candidatus Thiomargarita nelsonii]|uniref:Secreted protein n=1 Tax=Candidatus Thiomargarita nelsonii TaxID=1003181 RepID=A0A0A6P085_9GAMM|nr:secreted protein [Candidatus Thiomargarita nelsonii]
MKIWLTKPQRRDSLFAAFILANLVCIGGFLFSSTETALEQTGGWRRIDLDALTTRINAGDLVDKEADWYRPIDGGENPGKR